MEKPAEVDKRAPKVQLLNEWGTPIKELKVSSNLRISLSGLHPFTMYSILLSDGTEETVSWARLTSDRTGAIAPFVLWYQTGLVGCNQGVESLKGNFWFRSIEEASKHLTGMELVLEILDMEGKAVAKQPLKVEASAKLPVLHAGNKDGCFRSSFKEDKEDVYIVGKNFPPGSIVQVFLVPAQHQWKSRDPLHDIRGAGRKRDVLKIMLEEGQTSFVKLLWKAGKARVGSYDLAGRHYLEGEDHIEWDFFEAGDIISYQSSTGFVVQRVWGRDPHLSEDIAGRKIYGSPWFEHVDGFQKGQDVWGADVFLD